MRELSYSLGEVALNAAHVFLGHLPVADLVLHLARLLGRAPEQQQATRQPVQPVDGAQVLEVVLLGQDEDDGVVAVPAARVDLPTKMDHTPSRHPLKR